MNSVFYVKRDNLMIKTFSYTKDIEKVIAWTTQAPEIESEMAKIMTEQIRGISIHCDPRGNRFTLVIDSEDYFVTQFSGFYEMNSLKREIQFRLFKNLV